MQRPDTLSTARRALLVALIATAVLTTRMAATACLAQTDNATCLDCHNDASMVSEKGRPVGILARTFQSSVHRELACTDCHSAPGDYENVPHFKRYTPVDCSTCHDDAAAQFKGSIHAGLFARAT